MNKDSIGKNKPGGSVSQQIDRALASGEQFGMLLLPGENEPRWFGKGYGSGMMTMEVAPWLAPFASRLVIGDGVTATTTTAAGTHPDCYTHLPLPTIVRPRDYVVRAGVRNVYVSIE